MGNVRRYRDGGHKDVWVYPEPATARLRAGTPTVLVNGVEAGPTSWLPELKLAATDEKVRAVVAFLASGTAWSSLYAAVEVVMKDSRTGGRKGITQWSSISYGQLERFTATANSFAAVGVAARHGPRFAPPADPMTLGDAASLASAVISAWLEQLLERSAN